MLKSFKIGHFTDEQNGTGCSVILAPKGAVGGVCVRGAAPATRECDLLRDGKTVQKLNAVVLSGGSAFGLDAAGGVMRYCLENKIGYDAGAYLVPIVAGASLYDLEYKSFAFPDADAGYRACVEAVSGNFAGGDIGAGTGATVSKVMGMAHAAKGGLGVQTLQVAGLQIAVIVAVNALGDIVKDSEIILGAKTPEGDFLDCAKVMSLGAGGLKHQNTTIGCVLTNAQLTKEQANRLADLAHDGFAQSISPAHTAFDGDAMFVMSSGETSVDFNILSVLVPELTAKAIRSVAEGIRPEQKKIGKTTFKLLQRFFK